MNSFFFLVFQEHFIPYILCLNFLKILLYLKMRHKIVTQRTPYKVQPLNDKSKYNFFINVGSKKNYFNRTNILFYYKKEKSTQKLDYRILKVNDIKGGELFLLQIE